MAEKWVMVRVPGELKSELQAYALTLWDQLEPKQQGNHEDPRDWSPPLWRVIQELLRRDKDHRERSKRNNRTRAAQVTFDAEGGFRDASVQQGSTAEGSVYTGPASAAQDDQGVTNPD